MKVSGTRRLRVAIVSGDSQFADGLARWIAVHDGALEVVLSVANWGDLLNDPGFPTDLAVVDAASSQRKSIESRVRTIRASGTAVLVVTAADPDDDPQRALSAGAFTVLEKSVPFGLIDEMARGALGLPLAPPSDTAPDPTPGRR
ncbi:response regulator [Herbiconiux daphne]|uniref:Response regulator n=1 Tax=Herbiconiux daphne TaxID=2970914 RepID=A0ABT2H6T4_9MICO|nr:response regulator [Herbiconiux daphne]MCS5735632.1 response regulator [Herbiconiux daphne]